MSAEYGRAAHGSDMGYATTSWDISVERAREEMSATGNTLEQTLLDIAIRDWQNDEADRWDDPRVGGLRMLPATADGLYSRVLDDAMEDNLDAVIIPIADAASVQTESA